MFSFFKKKKIPCPVDENTRIWMENALIWLINQFGEEKILSIKTLVPSNEYFPIDFNGTEKVAYEILKIITVQMNISPADVRIDFYNEGLRQLQEGGTFTLSTQQYEDEGYSAGQYFGKDSDGKFLIAVERTQLKEPEKLIATIAHELGHIKILGENRLKENDEHLTDLVTVFFGLGVFTANSSGRFNSGFDGWRYSKQGYLTQQEWGYALALYAHIRREDNPSWTNHLTKNIKSDFAKSKEYILQNKDKVLV
jgi:hypothetical protein